MKNLLNDAIKTCGNVEFDVIYDDGTRYHAEEGVLFEAKDDRMFFHLGTCRPEVLFSVANALTEVIHKAGLGQAFERYVAGIAGETDDE